MMITSATVSDSGLIVSYNGVQGREGRKEELKRIDARLSMAHDPGALRRAIATLCRPKWSRQA